MRREDIEDDIEPTNIPIPGSGGQGCKAKMNLNIATKVQLMQAVQIGPAFANDLITARPFGSWDEVAKLSGIGKVRLSNLQSLFFLSAGSTNILFPIWSHASLGLRMNWSSK